MRVTPPGRAVLRVTHVSDPDRVWCRAGANCCRHRQLCRWAQAPGSGGRGCLPTPIRRASRGSRYDCVPGVPETFLVVTSGLGAAVSHPPVTGWPLTSAGSRVRARGRGQQSAGQNSGGGVVSGSEKGGSLGRQTLLGSGSPPFLPLSLVTPSPCGQARWACGCLTPTGAPGARRLDCREELRAFCTGR